MSLWGKLDNKFSAGTVSVNHANRTVTGSGTTFGGGVGYAATGDIIRFGQPLEGPLGFFGEAVITGIAGTQSIVIDSTAGISPQEIIDKGYQITQSPKSVVTDAAFNKFSRAVTQRGDVKLSTTVDGDVAIGATVVNVAGNASAASVAANDVVIIEHGDILPRLQFQEVFEVVGTSTVVLKNALPSTHSAFKTDGEAYGTGVAVVNIQEAPFRRALDGGAAGAHIKDIQVGDTFTSGTNSIGIGTIAHVVVNAVPTAILTLDTNLSQAISASTVGVSVIIKRGAISGSKLTIRGKESLSGDETQVLGVSTAGVQGAQQTLFDTGAGWVGVTTYLDTHGNVRVKKEVLVAMSGIATGNLPIYDGNSFA